MIQFAIFDNTKCAGKDNPCAFKSIEDKFYNDTDSNGKYLHGKDESGRSRYTTSLFLMPYRVKREELDFTKWNHCIYIDRDTKRWYNEKKELKDERLKKVPPQLMIERLNHVLSTLYTNNYYCIVPSSSGCSFHAFFYFNVDIHDKREFHCLYDLCDGWVSDAMCRIGLRDVDTFNGVADKCSRSPMQQCFWSPNKDPLFNERMQDNEFGRFDMLDNLIYEYKDDNKDDTHREPMYDYLYWVERVEQRSEVPYIDHFERWRLFNMLVRLYSDDEQLKLQWQRCANMIPQENGHSHSFYRKEPYYNDWWDNRTNETSTFIDKELLDMFGYIIGGRKLCTNPNYLYNLFGYEKNEVKNNDNSSQDILNLLKL